MQMFDYMKVTLGQEDEFLANSIFLVILQQASNYMDSKTLIEKVCRTSGTDKAQAERILSALCDILISSAVEMDVTAIPGFGNFEPKKRLERVMAVPSTGKRMLLPPKIYLSFKPSAILKQQLRESKLV